MIAEKSWGTEHTDEQLMGRVASGDVRAFEMIYDRHNRQAFALAKRITGRIGGAEEATQDAFIALWGAAPTFDPDRASLRSWLLTVVRNRSIDWLRKGTRHAHHQEPAENAAEGIEAPERTDEQVIAMEQYGNARRLVAELSPEQRQVIDLAYTAGYSQSEIAARVGIPIGTVKGRTRLGLLKLRDAATRESALARTV